MVEYSDRDILAGFASPVFVLNAKAEVVAQSVAAARLVSSSLTGTGGLLDGLSAAGTETLLRSLSECQSAGLPHPVSLDLREAPGDARPLTGSLVPLATQSGEPLFHLHLDTPARNCDSRLEERLRLATTAAGMGVWEYDIGTGRTSWDDITCKLHGIAPDDFDGSYETFKATVHPDDLAPIEAGLFEHIASGEPFDYEFRVIHPGGDIRTLKARAEIILDDASEPMRVVGVAFDITEFKAAEANALKAAEKERQTLHRFNLLADNAPGALFEYWEDADGKVSYPYYSASFTDMLGITVETIETTPARTFSRVHPDDLPGLAAAIETSRKDLSAGTTRYRVLHPERGERWILASTQPVRQPDGSIIWYGNIVDVTEQATAESRAEEAAEKERQTLHRLNLLADNAPGALFEYHELPNGDITYRYFSAKFPDMFGQTADALRKDPKLTFSVVNPDDIQHRAALMDAARKAETMYAARYRVNHPTLGERLVLASSQPVRQPDGSTVWFGNLVDVTELAAAERRADLAAAELKRANQRFQRMADNAPAALFEMRDAPDGTTSITHFSAQFPQMHSVSGEELKAEGPAALMRWVNEDDAPGIGEAKKTARETGSAFHIRYRVDHPELGERWIMASSDPFPQEDGSIIWYGSAMDITEMRHAEERAAQTAHELQRAHDRLQRIANVAPVALYEMSQDTETGIGFPYFSERFLEISGQSRSDVLTRPRTFLSKIVPEDRDTFVDALQESAQRLQPFKRRFRLEAGADAPMWVQVVSDVRRADNGTVFWTGAMIDVTADVKREEALREARVRAEVVQAENEWQAMNDSLTNLPNRRCYDRTFSQRLKQARSGKKRDVVLIRLDLDHFKHVNDTLGHEAGDLVLTHVARSLKQSIRLSDFAARIGGDEFSILLEPGTSEEGALRVVDRIRRLLKEPVYFKGRPCWFGSSFGLARVDDFAEVGDDLNLFADAALYRAKDLGRDRVELFTPALHREIVNSRRISEDIHQALERKEFIPYFQPQISARTQEVIGAEVLMRWNHPEQGVLAPNAFANVAAQLKVEADIDQQIMAQTRDTLARFEAQGVILPKVSLNVSSSRMQDPATVEQTKEIAKGKTRVAIELLESILIEDESDTFRVHLNQLREAGVEIEIDDFGSGHASILSVIECAPTALKIDRRLVQPVEQDPRTQKLVRAIIEIAETLEIKTIAEGIETPRQQQILAELGCDVLQGFLFARPMDEAALLTFLREWDSPQAAPKRTA